MLPNVLSNMWYQTQVVLQGKVKAVWIMKTSRVTLGLLSHEQFMDVGMHVDFPWLLGEIYVKIAYLCLDEV